MSQNHGHNDYGTYAGALNRSLTLVQEHDRGAVSAQPSVEIPIASVEIRIPTQQDYVPQQTGGAVETEALSETQADRIESAEIRNAERLPRNSPLDPRRFQRPTAVTSPIDIPKHQRRCCICQHPDRDAIEEAFLQWRRPGDIRSEHKLPNRSSIYRHAHAFRLFEQRAGNLRFALENIIEESSACNPSADSIIRAIRAYACLDHQGRWVEPPRHLIFSREPVPARTLASGKQITVEPTVIGDTAS